MTYLTGPRPSLFNNVAPENAVAVMSRDSQTRVSIASQVEK